MEYNLHGKIALVTGSTAGIGLSIAKLLALEGAEVVINGRTQERVESAMQQIKSVYAEAKLKPAPADLSNVKGIEALIHHAPSVDILVNNFGIYEEKAFKDITDDDWFHFFDCNVMSGVRLSRHYLDSMIKKNWGRIVFISSESGLQIPPEMIHYGMTKTAQIAIARGIAETTVGTNVTVNTVLPGPTNSEGLTQFVEKIANSQNKTPGDIEKEVFTSMRPSSLLKRFITTDEVAAMVGFLCSPWSSATNGANIRVDGGIIRSIA